MPSDFATESRYFSFTIVRLLNGFIEGERKIYNYLVFFFLFFFFTRSLVVNFSTRKDFVCREFIRVNKFDSLVSPLSLSLFSFEENLILDE